MTIDRARERHLVQNKATLNGAGGIMPGKSLVSLNTGFGVSSLGLVLVAECAGEICAVSLGDDRLAMLNELHKSFPNVPVNRAGSPQLSGLIARVVRCIENPDESRAELPLHILGTSFQCDVWRALQEIPPGEVRTYAELARATGHPDATRAVANACGANKLAVVIPCHRVVRSDGGLGGYRWGVTRKERLLNREAGIEHAICTGTF